MGHMAGEHEVHMGPMAGEHEGRMGPMAGGSYQDLLPFLEGGPGALATHRTASTIARSSDSSACGREGPHSR